MERLERNRKDYTETWRSIEEKNKHLRSVLEMFHYDLKKYDVGGDGSTWVVYVTRRSESEPIYPEEGFNVASPGIIIAMVVKVNENFCTPLGIFESLIGEDSDRHAKLSMPLYYFVARTMEQIRPGVKYVVFRPYHPLVMQAIKSSGKHYSESDGKTELKEKPYIFCEQGMIAMHNFVLVDPRGDGTRYEISDKHWFKENPYLSFHRDFKKSPFVWKRKIEKRVIIFATET